jgi:flagellar protein FlgJ
VNGVGNSLAADARGVESLRAAAARDPKAAIREAAKQFEALFMHELMKSMRQATQTSGVPDDSTTQLGTEMLDTQFAQQMTGLRGGLSEAIARHLERQLGIAPGAAPGEATGDALHGATPTKLPPMIAQAAQELHRAGAATAAPDTDALTRSINTTLRVQRAAG